MFGTYESHVYNSDISAAALIYPIPIYFGNCVVFRWNDTPFSMRRYMTSIADLSVNFVRVIHVGKFVTNGQKPLDFSLL